MGPKGKANLTCLGVQAEPAGLRSLQELWGTEHGVETLMAKQRAGRAISPIFLHLASLSLEETGLAHTTTPTGFAHSQGLRLPRRCLVETWPTPCNENPSSLLPKLCTLALLSPITDHPSCTGE